MGIKVTRIPILKCIFFSNIFCLTRWRHQQGMGRRADRHHRVHPHQHRDISTLWSRHDPKCRFRNVQHSHSSRYVGNVKKSIDSIRSQKNWIAFNKINTTKCVMDLDKLYFCFTWLCWFSFRLEQLLLLTQLLQKMMLASKVAKIDSKIIISLLQFKSVTHYV